MKKSVMIIFISAALLMTAGCKSSTPSSKSGIYFDTIVSIDIYGASSDDSAAILDECMNMCSRYEELFDKNSKTGDIAKINQSGKEPVRVDKDTVSMISTALRYSSLTDGRFDITIAPVSALWDFHEENGRIPSDEAIREALTKVGWKNICVDDEALTVTASNGASIDAGAVAKGFIADRIADHLSQCPIDGAVVNIGGDIRLTGTKPGNRPFRIGINDPFSKGSIAAALTLEDKAVATSGTYERAFTTDGKKYHHILDTKTGYPVKTDIESVTVITGCAIDADCLCTVCIILGSEAAMELIEDTEDTEAVFILSDGSMVLSSGAGALITQ